MSGNGGSSTQWRSGIAPSLDSLSLRPENQFTISHSPPDGNAENATHPGVFLPGEERSEKNAHGRFNFSPSHQRTPQDLALDLPERFDDTPYVPPRVSQADLHTYPALHPRGGSVYDSPNQSIQVQYPYEGNASPSGSHYSLSSSSSTSSQRLHHDHLESSLQYSQVPSLQRPSHYPAYFGQLRVGLEHVRHGPQPPHTGGNYYRTHPHGFPLTSLLSPEVFEHDTNTMSTQGTSQRPSSSSSSSFNPFPNISSFSVSPANFTESDGSPFPDAGPYLRKQLGLSPQDAVNLYSLPDPPTGEKPSAPLPMLIKLAIHGSPKKQLTLQEIYRELENRFEWFRENKSQRSWKNSIRHNLSLNKVFRNVPRPITEPGKGSYWRLDVSEGEGYKRLRKRRTRNKMAASEDEDEEPSEMDDERPSPVDSFQHAGPSHSFSMLAEDAHIDPELRSEGHMVGEGRTRSTARRACGGSPYPSPSPRVQHGPLPATGQDTIAPGQSMMRPSQPAFGQSSFPTYPQSRYAPATSPSSSFNAVGSSSMAMAPSTSAVVRPQAQHVASFDRGISISSLPPRSDIEYDIDQGNLPAAQHVESHSEYQRYGNVMRWSPESSSSGSSRTWNDARSMAQTQDNQ